MTTTLFQNGVRFQDGSEQVTAATFNNRNLIINGDFRVDQRSKGALVLNSAGVTYNTVDRWRAGGTIAGMFSLQQTPVDWTSSGQFPPIGSTCSIQLNRTLTALPSFGAGDTYLFTQRIPYERTKKLQWGIADDSLTGNAGRGVTLSFWVKSQIARTYGGSITNVPPTQYSLSNSFVFSYTVTQANVWEQKKIYIPPPSTGTLADDGWQGGNGVGMTLNFSLGVGTTYRIPLANTNTWQPSLKYDVDTGNTFIQTFGSSIMLCGVQIEEGSLSDPTVGIYEFIDQAVEMLECQRYFREITAYTRASVSVSSALTSPINHSTMRALPTATIISQGGSNQSTSIVVNSESASAHRVATSTSGTSTSTSVVQFSAEI